MVHNDVVIFLMEFVFDDVFSNNYRWDCWRSVILDAEEVFGR